MIIINDQNYREVVSRMEDQGFVMGAKPRQSRFGGLACASVFADSVDKLIPENEWEDRVRAMQDYFAWRRYAVLHPDIISHDYQNGLPYCWAFSFTQCVKWCRFRQGLPYVDLGAESLGGDVNWRSAGNYLDSTIEYAATHGIAAREYIPMHVHNPSRFKPGWEENALLHVPIEWWDLGSRDMWAETVTLLLSGEVVYVGYDWWSHAVMLDGLVIQDGEICVHTPNTHGKGGEAIICGRRKVPSLGCFSPCVVTASAA